MDQAKNIFKEAWGEGETLRIAREFASQEGLLYNKKTLARVPTEPSTGSFTLNIETISAPKMKGGTIPATSIGFLTQTDVNIRDSLLQPEKTRQISWVGNVPKLKSDTKTKQDTLQVPKLKSLSSLKSDTLQRNKVIPKTIQVPRTAQIPKTAQKTKLIPRQVPRQVSYTQPRLKVKPKPKPKTFIWYDRDSQQPKKKRLPRRKRKKQPYFITEIKKRGQWKFAGYSKTLIGATRKIKQTRLSPSASGRVLTGKGEKVLTPIPKGGYRRSKVDPRVIVEKKGRTPFSTGRMTSFAERSYFKAVPKKRKKKGRKKGKK